MLFSICKRNKKLCKCVILIGFVISLSTSVALFSQIHDVFSLRDINQTDIYHPRNILPALNAKLGLHNSQNLESIVERQKNIPDRAETVLQKNLPANITQDKLKVHLLSKLDKIEGKIKNKMNKKMMAEQQSQPCHNVHAFYYPWYGTPHHDGDYYHWNHKFIQHWNKEEAAKWPKGQHVPPDDVGSNYFPLLGAYSSADPAVVDEHMQMMRSARIGVVVVSWYPPGDADTQGKEPDSLMNLLLDSAKKYSLKVAIHVEPFKDRDQNTMKTQMKYILAKYGNHPAFYRRDFGRKKNLPLVYIYDSYMTSPQDWAKVLKASGPDTIRNTELDAIFIGLWVEGKHGAELSNAGFDGFYTYFATNEFTHGSSWKNWGKLSAFAKSQNMLFIPSVGPGYIDTEVRPWNGKNTRQRGNGKYYDESFRNALKHKPDIVSITSFNEWHEGTQIEPAVSKVRKTGKYMDYAPNKPDFYLDKTRQWVNEFHC